MNILRSEDAAFILHPLKSQPAKPLGFPDSRGRECGARRRACARVTIQFRALAAERQISNSLLRTPVGQKRYEGGGAPVAKATAACFPRDPRKLLLNGISRLPVPKKREVRSPRSVTRPALAVALVLAF